MQPCRVGLRFSVLAFVHVLVADRSGDTEVSLGVNTRGSFNSLQTLQDVKATAKPDFDPKKNVSADALEVQRLRRQVEELEENQELRKKLDQAREEMRHLKEQVKSTLPNAKEQVKATFEKDAQKSNEQKKASEKAPLAPPLPKPKPKAADEYENPFGHIEDSLLEKRLEVAKLGHESEASASPQSPPLDANERLRLHLMSNGYLRPGKATAHEVTEALFASAKRKRDKEHRFNFREANTPRLIPLHRPKETVNKGFSDFMNKVQHDELFARTTALLQESSKEAQIHAASPDDSAIFQPFGEPEELDDTPEREIDRVALAKNIAARQKTIHDKAVRDVEIKLAKQRKEEEDLIVKDIQEQAKKVAQEQSRHASLAELPVKERSRGGNIAEVPVEERSRRASAAETPVKEPPSTQPHINTATIGNREAIAQEPPSAQPHTNQAALGNRKAPAQEPPSAQPRINPEANGNQKARAQEPRSTQPHIQTAVVSGRKAAAQTATEKPAHAVDLAAAAQAKETATEKSAHAVHPAAASHAKEARREATALPATPSHKEVHLDAQKVEERDDDEDDIPENVWEFSAPGGEQITSKERVALSMFSDKDPKRAAPPDGLTTKTEKATEHALKQQQSKADPQKQTEAKLSAQEAEIQKLQEQMAALQARSSREEEDSDESRTLPQSSHQEQEDSDESRTPAHELASDVIMQASS